MRHTDVGARVCEAESAIPMKRNLVNRVTTRLGWLRRLNMHINVTLSTLFILSPSQRK
jgi:hypothetical protein